MMFIQHVHNESILSPTLHFVLGIPFSVLYRWCRQQFLVSTDLALRSQLVEFVDHEVIKWKRDGDVLYVPVDIEVLVQFYKQNKEDDDD